MQDFRKRRSMQGAVIRAALSTMGVLVLMALVFFALRGAWGMYQKFVRASDASAQAETRLVALVARESALSDGVEGLQSPRGVEEALRERYGVARPGEGQIVVVRQEASTTGQSSEPGGWWERLWHAIAVW